jgi:surface protein
MCTVLHAIVAAALPLLAGSSAPAARQETGTLRGPPLAWMCRVGAVWGRPIGAERSQMPFFGSISFGLQPSGSSSQPSPRRFQTSSLRPQWAHLIDGQERNSQTKARIVYHVHRSLRDRHRRASPPRRFVSPGSAPVHAWAPWRAGTSGDRAQLVQSVGRSRVGRAAPASSVASIMRCADIGAALGLVLAVMLPSQTKARKSRSLTPTRLISFCAILAAHVLLRTPCALAVTPLTDGNIRTAATAWIDNPAAATTTYGAISEWDVSAVSCIGALFYQKPAFNADISKWNTARVSNMFGTLYQPSWTVCCRTPRLPPAGPPFGSSMHLHMLCFARAYPAARRRGHAPS